MFDEPTTIQADRRAPIQSLSLSRLDKSGDEGVGIALLCLNSWGQGMREIADANDVRVVVRDETSKQMRLGLEPVKTLPERRTRPPRSVRLPHPYRLTP